MQALRAAACLMVVLYHTLQAAYGEACIVAWPNGSAGVDLFFVISGYVMAVSSRRLVARPGGWRTFLAHRARRIVPLYWLLTSAKLVVVLLLPWAAAHTRPTTWNTVASYLFIPARDATGLVRPVLPVGWSLNFEVFFYALFASVLAARRAPTWVVPVLVLAALVGFFRDPGWPAPLFLANGMVLEFAAGLALAGWVPRLPGEVAAGLLAGGFVALLMLPLAGPWRFLVWGLPCGCILVGALGLEKSVGVLLPRWALAVGDASYAIYLVHPFVVPVVAHRVAGDLASVAMSVGAGVLAHRWLDRPMQRCLAGGAGLALRNGHIT